MRTTHDVMLIATFNITTDICFKNVRRDDIEIESSPRLLTELQMYKVGDMNVSSSLSSMWW